MSGERLREHGSSGFSSEIPFYFYLNYEGLKKTCTIMML